MAKICYHRIKLGILLSLLLPLVLMEGIIYAQDAQTYYKNGYIYFTQENYEQAEQHYKKAIELDPNFEEAHYWLGKVYRQIGDYSQAVEQWKKVLEINPKNPYAFSYLASSFQSTSRVRSDNPLDYFNEGIKMIGNPDEYLSAEDVPSVDILLSAVPYFKKAASLEPNLLEAYFWTGEVYRVLGDKINPQFRPLALENYEKAIDIEEATNSVSFDHPSAYWRSYIQLSKMYNSLQWTDKEKELWQRLEKARALPYQQVLEEKGYSGFGYPSRIEVSFREGDKIENWFYPEKDKILVVINGEVRGERKLLADKTETGNEEE